MAPGANVLYVAGKDCNDESLIAAMNKIVDKRQAQIVSNSYGDLGEDVPKGHRGRAWKRHVPAGRGWEGNRPGLTFSSGGQR